MAVMQQTPAPPDMQRRSLVLACRDIPADAQRTLCMILDILNAKTRDSWRLGDVEQASILLVAHHAVPHAMSGAGGRDTPIAVLDQEGTANAGSNDLVLRYPLRVANVLEFLESASGKVHAPQGSGTAAPASSCEPETPEPPTSGPDPAQMPAFDAGILANALAQSLVRTGAGQGLRVRIVGLGALHVWRCERLFHIDFPARELPRAMRERRHIITAFADDADHRLLKSDAQPIALLLWHLGLAGVRKHELGIDSHIRLKRWPEFNRLPHGMEHLRLCSVMGNRAWRMEELRQRSGLPLERIQGFLHACLLCDYAAVDDTNTTSPPLPAVLPPASTPKSGGLFERLWRRLGLKEGAVSRIKCNS